VYLIVSVLADDIPEINETMVVRLESIEPYTTQRLRPGATEINITILENDNPGGTFQFSTTMRSNYTVAVSLSLS
jgi:G-protein coupled receptor 98